MGNILKWSDKWEVNSLEEEGVGAEYAGDKATAQKFDAQTPQLHTSAELIGRLKLETPGFFRGRVKATHFLH